MCFLFFPFLFFKIGRISLNSVFFLSFVAQRQMENVCAKEEEKKKVRSGFSKSRGIREILETSSRRERNHALTFRSCHPISSPKSHIRPRMKLIYALFLLPSSEREVAREARGVHKSVDYLAVFESFLGEKKKEKKKKKKKKKKKSDTGEP